MIKHKNVALFGFGCVGKGLFEIANGLKSAPFKISKICVKDKIKPRNAPPGLLVYEKEKILDDDAVDIVIEAINDDQEAFEIVKQALQNNKTVVSASKKMLADNLKELIKIEASSGGALLYEASTGGSIPVIRTLQDYFKNIETNSLFGILNGSSNYVLSKIFNEGLSYEIAIEKAKELGFAETDPTLDVSGFDACNKLSILAFHGFHTHVDPADIFRFGIEGISNMEIEFAKKHHCKIKQVAIIKRIGKDKIAPLVLPALVGSDSPLHQVEEENNAVLIQNDFTGPQLLMGKGAGSLPTGWAVFSDLLAACGNYSYGNGLLAVVQKISIALNVPIPLYLKCNSDQIIKTLHFKVQEDLSADTRFRFVKGEVSLDNLLKFNSSPAFDKVFLMLDLKKFTQELSSATNDEKSILARVY